VARCDVRSLADLAVDINPIVDPEIKELLDDPEKKSTSMVVWDLGRVLTSCRLPFLKRFGQDKRFPDLYKYVDMDFFFIDNTAWYFIYISFANPFAI